MVVNTGHEETKCPSDNDLFPFGMHKGMAYRNVPAKYLDWLRDADLTRYPEVALYIERNAKCIDLELRGK